MQYLILVIEGNLRTSISCNEYKPAGVCIIYSKLEKKFKKHSNEKQIKTKYEKKISRNLET